MRFPELTRIFEKQCYRRLGDAYSEASRLLRFRKVVEEVRKQKGPPLKLLENKLSTSSKSWDPRGKKLAKATIASVVKITALLQLVQIKEQRVFELPKNSAILGLSPLNERNERDYTRKELSKEEKIYFLKKILENDSVTVLALLSLIEAKFGISSRDFREYHYNFIKINESLYRSAKPSFQKSVSNTMSILKKNIEGQQKSDVERAKEEYLRKRGFPMKGRKRKEGPPEYAKRIGMVRGWLEDLQLVKNAKLTPCGKRLLQNEAIYVEKGGDMTIRILLPEYDIIEQVFEEIPQKMRDKKINEDVITKMCSIAYGHDLSSKTYSFEDFYKFVTRGFDILKNETYYQANLDAVKEYVEIKSICEKNHFPDFDFYRGRIQQIPGITLLRSQRGRGYLVIRK